MARQTFETTGKGWLPEERESAVITAIASNSAIEKLARRVTMGTNSKVIPRSGTIGVGIVTKGTAYAEETGDVDEVTLVAKKIGSVVRLAEEDLEDSPIAIIENRKVEWASAYARFIDNAALAVTAAPGANVPFRSVYYSLTQTNAVTGYAANANIVKTAGVLTHAHLSTALAKLETGRYFDKSKAVCIADPSFRGVLREMKDGEGRLLFAPAPTLDQADTIFGIPIEWSHGARTSAVATDEPTGNPLLFFANRDFLILGVRSGPESVVVDGRDGASTLTDETLLKLRARRAFTLGHEAAVALVEKTAAA